ncbi:hypothetical protein ACFE04_009789 [Oxalis oulophora]
MLILILVSRAVPLKMSRFSRMIYVGNLPSDIRESEVEDIFYKYGRIVDIELKIPPRPPCFAFVEYENSRDAEDAIRGRDGYNFDGCRLRVELAHGGRGQSSGDRRGGHGGGHGGGRGSARNGISRHSEYRVIVRGLPSSASWQDLKDHMRKAGDVSFADVSRDSDGTFGIVDYTNTDDMNYAVRKLDDTEFKNPWARAHIRVIFLSFFDVPSLLLESILFLSKNYLVNTSIKSLERSMSRSRSVSKSRSASPVKSPGGKGKGRSRSRSRSRSISGSPPRKDKARSRSNSGSPPHKQGYKKLPMMMGNSKCFIDDILEDGVAIGWYACHLIKLFPASTNCRSSSSSSSSSDHWVYIDLFDFNNVRPIVGVSYGKHER